MAKVKITGHASGSGVLTITAPNTSTDRTITLPDATGTLLNSNGSGASLTNLPSDVIVSATAPSNPSQGALWFNSSASTVSSVRTKSLAVYNNTEWKEIDNVAFSGTGGTITTSGDYKIHTFTSSGTFTPNMAGTVEYLVIAGGGGAGRNGGGGGGAGGYLTATGFSVAANSLTVTVGAGGAQNVDGANSVFSSITATGGGKGAGLGGSTSGGSGGGGGRDSVGAGSGTSGPGNAGGVGLFTDPAYGGGGGGGAGAAGTNGTATAAGVGGVGLASSINGTSVYRAGGGGGGTYNGTGAGAAGNGGGGTGGSAGTANTGGGGGANTANGAGGAGGSGIVIVRYLT